MGSKFLSSRDAPKFTTTKRRAEIGTRTRPSRRASTRWASKSVGLLIRIPSLTPVVRRERPCHQRGNRSGVLTVLLPQGPDDGLPALHGVVLVQLPLALDALDHDAEADDLGQP